MLFHRVRNAERFDMTNCVLTEISVTQTFVVTPATVPANTNQLKKKMKNNRMIKSGFTPFSNWYVRPLGRLRTPAWDGL